MRACAAYKVPVVAFGIGSSLEGQVNAPFGGISVDFSRMNKVLRVNTEDLDCTVEPGVTREELNTYLRDTGEVINDLSMPIFINGRHWGAVRVGFDSDRLR